MDKSARALAWHQSALLLLLLLLNSSRGQDIACEAWSDCGTRAFCHHPGVSARREEAQQVLGSGPGTCRCSAFLYASNPPHCVEADSSSVFVVSLAHVATIAAMLGGAYHCSQAFVDHMWGTEDTKEPFLYKLLCLKVFFLTSSVISMISLTIKEILFLLMLYGFMDNFMFWHGSGESPYIIAFSLFFVFTSFWLVAIASLWVHVAAQLSGLDKQSARGCVWRMLVVMNGTMLGWILSLGLVVPMGALTAYFVIQRRPEEASNAGLLLTVCSCLFFYVGTWLLGHARSEGSQQRSWCDKLRALRIWRIQPTDGWETSSSAMQEGGTSVDPGGRRGSAVEMKNNQDAAQKRSALEEILRSTRTRTLDLPDQQTLSDTGRPDATLEEPANMHASPSAAVPSPLGDRSSQAVQIVVKESPLTSFGDAAKSPDTHLDKKLKRVHREARTLALRTATYLLIGVGCIMIAQVLLAADHVAACVVLRHAGFCAWLVANLNCLYYLSWPLRAMVHGWGRSDSPFLVLLSAILYSRVSEKIRPITAVPAQDTKHAPSPPGPGAA